MLDDCSTVWSVTTLPGCSGACVCVCSVCTHHAGQSDTLHCQLVMWLACSAGVICSLHGTPSVPIRPASRWDVLHLLCRANHSRLLLSLCDSDLAALSFLRCLLAQMDVVYEGPLVLTESQVQQLLKYQSLINKHTNWDKTRAEVGRSSWCRAWRQSALHTALSTLLCWHAAYMQHHNLLPRTAARRGLLASGPSQQNPWARWATARGKF